MHSLNLKNKKISIQNYPLRFDCLGMVEPINIKDKIRIKNQTTNQHINLFPFQELNAGNEAKQNKNDICSVAWKI